MKHAMKGYETHEHETVADARACEELNAKIRDTNLIPQGVVKEKSGLYRKPKHDTPCVCGPYDRCHDVRVADAQWSGNWRDMFRAYND